MYENYYQMHPSFFVTFFQVYKHNMLLVSYYKLQLYHVLKFQLMKANVLLLVEKSPEN